MITILFISISGNTRHFAQNLQDYAKIQHAQNQVIPEIELKEISDATEEADEKQPFFVLVPTYLEGGNGLDNGTQEIMTSAMRDYLAYHDNAKHCLGVVGSGNKNFNNQYCLTAHQYADAFGFPFLADYELRGTNKDTQRIYEILVARAKAKANY